MLFNSYIFVLLFLPVVLTAYYTLNNFKKYNSSKITLIFASLWFYAYFNYSYLFIIVFSILVNFFIVKIMKKISNMNWRKMVLGIGILLNLSVLFYYKYMGFFTENINMMFGTSFNIVNLVLPLGISFFTFQQLSFVIDSYKGNIPDYSIIDYSLFVTFFPQLIAGPIVLHDEMIPQFENEKNKKINFDNMKSGLRAFSMGMAKKVLIADTLGNAVNYGFGNLADINSLDSIIVILSYTFQIYFDFSGYCDMAIGIGKMFNIDIPVNFNSPYKALTINEFWKRWHITLTRFLKTYVYIPLGGNRKGNVRTYINLAIVFLVSGLWHGANYTFILWGAMHGVAMLINRRFKVQFDKMNIVLSWIVTFIFLNITWVFFRADNVYIAIDMIKNVFNFNFSSINASITSAFILPEFEFVFSFLGSMGTHLSNLFVPVALVFVLVLTLCFKNTSEKIKNHDVGIVSLISCSMLLIWCVCSFSGISTFLYFNF